MPPDQSQLNDERLDAYRAMIEEEGASPSGQLPDAQYISAALGAAELGEAETVREAHSRGDAPPQTGRGNNA